MVERRARVRMCGHVSDSELDFVVLCKCQPIIPSHFDYSTYHDPIEPRQTTTMAKYRLRDIPAIPLLALLHALFILTSLVVRVFECLRSPQPPRRDGRPPRHVAIVLTSHNTFDQTTSLKHQARLQFAVVESVRRCIEWAAEGGIAEISVWNKDGMLAIA